MSNNADIISMSLGTTVDLTTGEGAGLQAAFDRVTYAASQAGIILIAAAGNDGYDLTNPRYIELPAQARDVLAIVASTNPDCAQNTAAGAVCTPGPTTLAYYSNFGAPLNALAAPGGSYPAGSDTGVTGWIRGACSTGIARHHRRSAQRSHPQLRLLQSRPHTLRSSHGNQRLNPTRRRRRRPASLRPPRVERLHRHRRNAFLSSLRTQPARPPNQRSNSPQHPLTNPAIARLLALHPVLNALRQLLNLVSLLDNVDRKNILVRLIHLLLQLGRQRQQLFGIGLQLLLPVDIP